MGGNLIDRTDSIWDEDRTAHSAMRRTALWRRRTRATAAAATAAATVVALAEPILVGLGALVTLDGALQYWRARIRWSDPGHRRHPAACALAERERRLVRAWIASGAALTTAPLLVPFAALVAGVGFGIVTWLFVLAWMVGADTAAVEEDLALPGASRILDERESTGRLKERAQRADELPGMELVGQAFGPKRQPGKISAFLAHSLAAMLVIAAGYAGVAIAHGVTAGVRTIAERAPHLIEHGSARRPMADRHGKNAQGRRGDAEGRSLAGVTAPAARAVEPPLTYASLCPSRPDPLSIGHGLGELFRRDGAVQAGCGGPALQLAAGGPWVAAGVCAGNLRSVGVSAPGRPPALIYESRRGSPGRKRRPGACASPGSLTPLAATWSWSRPAWGRTSSSARHPRKQPDAKALLAAMR